MNRHYLVYPERDRSEKWQPSCYEAAVELAITLTEREGERYVIAEERIVAVCEPVYGHKIVVVSDE